MTISATNILLYAATANDCQLALGAAAVAGIAATNVIRDFETAWEVVADGTYLVIAVGDDANNALYYNPCGWTNPDGSPAGETPFETVASPVDSLPGANYYENAAGPDNLGTIEIAAAFAYYAVNGHFLEGYSSYPTPSTPSDTCAGSASAACPCSIPGTLSGTVESGGANATGLDTDDVISSTSAGEIATAGLTFVIRYVSLESAEQSGDLTSDEAANILAAGLALMPVQHVAEPGWTPTSALGTTNGQNAAGNVRSVGFPSGVNVWLDLEGIAEGTATPAIIDYCNNWAAAVRAAPYSFSPGLYVGYDTFLSADQLAQLDFQHYWESESSVPSPTGRGYQMVQTGSESGYGITYDPDATQYDELSGTVQWLAPS